MCMLCGPVCRATCAQFLKDCPFYGKTLHIVVSSRSPEITRLFLFLRGPLELTETSLFSFTYVLITRVHRLLVHFCLAEHQSVAMPRPDSDPVSMALTSDYSSSPLHRFRAGTKHAMVRARLPNSSSITLASCQRHAV